MTRQEGTRRNASFWIKYFLLTLSLLTIASYLPAQGTSLEIASPEVYQTLQTQPDAQVIILFEEPIPKSAPLRVRMERIARLQDNILATLIKSEFKIKRTYKTIAAMAGKITKAGVKKLVSNPNVESIGLDEVRHIIGQPSLVPLPPTRPELTESVPLINADEVHGIGITGTGVTVAVIDTGIDPDHPDLADDLIAEHCFTDGSCPPYNTNESTNATDDDGHGTSVAGIITSSGTNGIAPKGVAPEGGIAAIKVCDQEDNCWSSDIVAAIDWVVANKSKYNISVINISLGGGLYDGICDTESTAIQAEAEAINTARNNGIITFAASGNEGSGSEMSAPACTSGAVSVGSVYDANVGSVSWGDPLICNDSTTYADKVVCFTNSNSYLDLMGPGAFINTTSLEGGHGEFHGTSSASPHAAAVAALLMDAGSLLTPNEIETTLENTGVPVTDTKNSLTFPRIDAWAAVKTIMETEAIFRVTREGDVFADGTYSGSGFHSGTGADIAEYIKVNEPVESGDLVELDPKKPGYYRKSSYPYSTLVAGVISTHPGVIMGKAVNKGKVRSLYSDYPFNSNLHLEGFSLTKVDKELTMHLTLYLKCSLQILPERTLSSALPFFEVLTLPTLEQLSGSGFSVNKHPQQALMALMGVVPVKATTENGPIEPGDLLVSSSAPGYVMRCANRDKCTGAIVGKALGRLKKGTGGIKILLIQ